jgi:hypothetical protein
LTDAEVHAATDPTDPSHAIAAWQALGGPAGIIQAAASFDGGATWSDPAPVPIPALGEGLDHDAGILGARPEHVRLSDGAAFRGRVFGIEYTGARKILAIDTDVGRVRVRASNTVAAQIGETVGLDFMTSRLSLFDAKSERALALASSGGAHG